MLMRLDLAWLMMAVALVTVICFFFGSLLDTIMREDGFGPLGNTALLVVGFFGGILLLNIGGIRVPNLGVATATGLTGSFLLLSILALVKAGLARF
jgi:hypothetical protein